MTLLAVSHQPQRQESDCLAACSAMVLNYLHVPYTYPQLLRLLQIQAFGAWFRNIQFLQSLGLSVVIGYGDVEILEVYLDVGLPIIAYVDTGFLTSYWRESTNHAVVVIGIEDESIYLNDPFFQAAPQILSLNEFLPAWIEQKQLYAAVGLTTIDTAK
jgi:ABC-type bacteriocin/lantibiotic exporter with double-glycine peptidase domain